MRGLLPGERGITSAIASAGQCAGLEGRSGRPYSAEEMRVRTLASIEVEIPSRDVPARFSPKLMPFGKAFFLEAASPWNGSLDLLDDASMRLVESYRQKR